MIVRTALLLACALAGALAGCGKNDTVSNTAVLGGYGPAAADAALRGEVSPPPAPRNATPQLAIVNREHALAVWEEQGQVMATSYSLGRGWETPRPLEDIHGQASNARIAANRDGIAMAVWQHTVGRIDSLRFSRYQPDSGWSQPDVVPGALPRPRQPGKTAGASVQDAAPRIELDERGNASALWLSGFAEGEVQASTYVHGKGWARPVDLPLQAGAGLSDAAR